MGRFAATLALAALAGCAGPAREGRPPPAGEVVRLRFAWPTPFEARVSIQHEFVRTGQPPTGALIRHRLVAEPRGDELWILNRDTEGHGNEPDLELNLRVGEALAQVVGLDGAFRRAEGLDPAASLLAPDDEQRRVRVRESLARLVAQDWEVTVGAWRGQAFAEGELQRKEVAATLPLVPGVATRMAVELGMEGRVPCSDDETERRCVALFYRGLPAASDRAEALARLGEALRRDQGEAELEDFGARLEVRLTTDPDTLVPRRMVVTEELRLRVRLPDGRVREVEERSRDEYRFVPALVI